MSKNGKIFLGIVSFVPIVLVIVYMISFFSLFTSVFHESVQQGNRPPEFMMGNVGMLMALVPLLIVSSLGLFVYYFVHITNNTRIDNIGRLVWIFVIVATNAIGFPVYWYMQIWKAPEEPFYQSS
jgi:uncharacterized membrane protein